MKRALITLIFSSSLSADQSALDLEPLAWANVNCAAFYAAAQMLVKPEAKKEQESKFNAHYSLSHQFTSAYERISKDLNAEIQREFAEAASLTEREQVSNYLSRSRIKCSVIEMNSVGVLRGGMVKKDVNHE